MYQMYRSEKKGIVLIVILSFVLALVNVFSMADSVNNDSQDRAIVIEKIDKLIQEETKRNNIQGLSVGLVGESGLFWSKGYGYEDKKNKIEATEETLYRVASVTKPFTATGIMILVDRGLVDLDAPIKKYISEFSINRVNEKSRLITVRDLLNHHSGLKRDHYKGINTKSPPVLDFLVDELKNDYLALPTGTLYKYSNINYALLGLIIEKVSGKSYNQFMEDEIFQPLRMEDSFVGYDETGDRISKSYEMKGFLFKRAKEIDQYRLRDRPAGSIVSSVEDTAKFVRMILNDGRSPGGDQVISKESLDEMLIVQYPENELDDDPYGLGWKVNKVPLSGIETNIRHGGTLNGFSTLIVVAPEEGLGIIVYYNTNHVFSRHFIANEALRLLADEKTGQTDAEKESLEDRRVPLNSIKLEEYLGKYVGVGDLPLVMDLKLEGDSPTINLSDQKLALEKIDDYRYRVSKRILFFSIGVGRFMGVDETLFDFYRTGNGTIYPRLVLEYRDLEMKILFDKVQSYDIPESIKQMEGRYAPAEKSLPYLDDDSFRELELKIQGGWITLDTSWEGNVMKFLLKPLGGVMFRAIGSGEVITVENEKIHYSGLVFERE